MYKILLQIAGFTALALGLIGIVIPVLPTTPFLLLAAFLLAKSSPKMHALLVASKPYQLYVEPFKDAGGMPLGDKIKALAITYIVMGISAYLVQKVHVWIILVLCGLLVFYIIMIHIKTIPKAEQAKAVEESR